MKVVTWNVNSIRARLPRVLEFLDQHAPDVLCVQETKCEADAFPHEELAGVGYHAVDHSTGRWAGVAVIARADLALTNVVRGLPGSPMPEEGRWVETDVDGVRVTSVYVINGRSLDDDMYPAKLSFLEAMAAWSSSLGDTPRVVCGDFNIAPADIDVYDPAAFVGATHVSPPERERLQALLATGLVDAYRHIEPERVQHTWWDYRAGNFHKGLGLRIDLVLASGLLAAALTGCGIDRDFRKGPKPSDHAPLIAQFDRWPA
ncbi:MAG: exodeoxyribonuclease III [Chloroflexi bacterium]|nr:exodeoxyribonuclease III [Chloroflexota bacterium]MDA1002916.1 exodeoxyribonuclease III [Chloroflexota bacterium]